MWGNLSSLTTLTLSSLMFMYWSTECSVPVMARSFFSSTVTCSRAMHRTCHAASRHDAGCELLHHWQCACFRWMDGAPSKACRTDDLPAMACNALLRLLPLTLCKAAIGQSCNWAQPPPLASHAHLLPSKGLEKREEEHVLSCRASTEAGVPLPDLLLTGLLL